LSKEPLADTKDVYDIDVADSPEQAQPQKGSGGASGPFPDLLPNLLPNDATAPLSPASTGFDTKPQPPADTEWWMLRWGNEWIDPWRESWIDQQDDWGFDRHNLSYVDKRGLVHLKLGGRIAADAGLLWQDAQLDRSYTDFTGSKSNIRSAQLQLHGSIGPHIFFKLQFDAGSVNAGLRDAYVVVQDVPVLANVRFGQGKQPFSLENNSSLKYSETMERSLAMALVPGRSFGVMAYDSAYNQRVTWAAGIFYRSADWGDYEFDRSAGSDLTGRITALPLIDEDQLLHIGVGLSKRIYADDTRFASSPESRLVNNTFVDTGEFTANDASTINIESAWQRGPLLIQGEYTHNRVATDSEDRDYQGGYLQAAWFVTGEHRPYNKASATFGELVPAQPLLRGTDARGAWELVARYSKLDLQSHDYAGGMQSNITLGVNWYPGWNVRWMLNYIRGDVDSLQRGRFTIWQTRILFYF
jgi:phosphate-selective porin OprO/OprP